MAEWERVIVEDDVAGSVHPPGFNVEASVAAVVGRVADEDACNGAWRELVRCRCREVGVAQASKHAEVTIMGRDAEQQLEQCRDAGGAARSAIDEVCCCGEGFCPKLRRCCTVY